MQGLILLHAVQMCNMGVRGCTRRVVLVRVLVTPRGSSYEYEYSYGTYE